MKQTLYNIRPQSTAGVLLFALVMLLSGCITELETVTDANGVNRWVYSTMQRNYLWANDMKPLNEKELALSPTQFYEKAVRYRHDKLVVPSDDTYGDRFSGMRYIGTHSRSAAAGPSLSSETIKNDFGFEVRYFIFDDQIGFCQVIYVLPGSPADKAGVRRGDFFNQINADKMPMSPLVYSAQMYSHTIQLHIFDPREAVVEVTRGVYYDTPLIHSSIVEGERPTAYLVYNHFTAGQDNCFTDELSSAFREFRAAGARDMVLDLRYNPGGEISAARLLASLIAKRSMLGEPFVYKESRVSCGRPSQFEPEYFMGIGTVGDRNCDIERLIVLTSSNTASASELLIHALKPYYGDKMTVIGERTVGKNVGGIKITNRQYQWELNVITLRTYDCNKVSGYESGIAPDILSNEFVNFNHIGQFGDTHNERLLSIALGVLSGKSPYETTQKSAPQATLPRYSTSIAERDLIVGEAVIE